jgi:2-isopropylmalate synthase
MKYREGEHGNTWTVPYLPIDPVDIGRAYEADVIRINSQSGKGGIGYILETQFKLMLPQKMRETFGYHVKGISDHAHKELSPKEVYDIFYRDFVNVTTPMKVVKTSLDESEAMMTYDASDEKNLGDEMVRAKVGLEYNGERAVVGSHGAGRLDCVCNAIKRMLQANGGITFKLESYTQHALGDKSDAEAMSYVCISSQGKTYWGAGVHADIMTSSVNALLSAVNIMLGDK